jgi:hypothetical protein
VWALRWLPRAGVLAVVGLLLVGAVLSQQRFAGTSLVATRWEPVAGRMTPSDLEAIARGSRDGREFADRLRTLAEESWAADDWGLEVRLMPPAGYRLEGKVYGWPTQIASYSTRAQYEDVFTPAGPIARDWGVSYSEFWNNVGGSTGGAPMTLVDAHWNTWAGPVALVICYVLLGWYAGAGAAWLWKRARRRPAVRRRCVAAAGALAVAFAVGVGTWATAEHVVQNRLEPSPPMPVTTPPVIPAWNTGWTIKDLRAALGNDGAAPALARQLLSVFPADCDRTLNLDVGVTISQTAFNHASAGFPSEWLFWGDSPASGWPGVFQKPGLRVNEHGLGQATYSSPEGSLIRYWTLDGPALAIYAVMAWISWHMLRASVVAIDWIVSCRRRSRGQCASCGYDLAGLGAAAARC